MTFGYGFWPLCLWGAGVVALLARHAQNLRRLCGIINRSQDIAPETMAAWAVPTDILTVRVRKSAEVPTPCLARAWRPVLLLPERFCRDDCDRDEVHAVLAHELCARARNHDLAWNEVLHLISMLFWFHPLVWRVRQVHASACDAVCDAVAADQLGDVGSYTRVLARLALRAAATPFVPGLAMARVSDVRRRIESLQQRVFRSPLPRKFVMPAIIAFGLCVVLIGGVGFTTAEPPANTKPSPTASSAAVSDDSPTPPAVDGRLEIQAVAAATGKPVAGGTVVWSLRVNGGRWKRTTNSIGGDGRTILEWPKGATVNGLQLTARKEGFVPYTILWDDSTHPLLLPAVKVLRLVPGVTIGGVVTGRGRPPGRRGQDHGQRPADRDGSVVLLHRPCGGPDERPGPLAVRRRTRGSHGRERRHPGPRVPPGRWSAVAQTSTR